MTLEADKNDNLVEINDEELPQEFVDKQLKKIDIISRMTMPENIKSEKPKVKRMKKVRAKKRTLEEFKNWLEGLQEFQPDNWVPSSDQWEHIKASIAAIKESHIDRPVVVNNTTYDDALHTAMVPKTYVRPVSSSLDVAPSIQTTGNNQHIDMRKPDSIKADIDTSDGNYKSDFE